MPKSLKLEDVMTKNVITVGERATVKTVVELMNKRDIGCLIVMRRKKPVGIVTERDVLERVLLSPKNTKNTKVSDMLMRKVDFEYLFSVYTKKLSPSSQTKRIHT